jgi:hypothetical protein
VIQSVAADGDTATFGFIFLWTVVAAEASICDLMALGDLVFVDEVHGACAVDTAF